MTCYISSTSFSPFSPSFPSLSLEFDLRYTMTTPIRQSNLSATMPSADKLSGGVSPLSVGTSQDEVLMTILTELKNIKLNQARFEQKLEALALPPSTPQTYPSSSPPHASGNPSSINGLLSSPVMLPQSITAATPRGQHYRANSSGSSVVPHSSGIISSSPKFTSSMTREAHGQGPTHNQSGTSTPYVASTPPSSGSTVPESPSLQARKEGGAGGSATGYSQRVILTTYPGQVGIHPIPLHWGAPSAQERGPVVASRHVNSLKVRNAIGAYSGSYSIYRALSAACGLIDPNHRPDYTNTEPPVDILHNPSWDDKWKIVSIDPYGHLAPQVFKSYFDAGIDIRPTISITKAHIKLIDIDEAVKSGSLPIDGKIVVKTPTEWINENKKISQEGARTERAVEDDAAKSVKWSNFDSGVELNVSKAALEPVWYLPGIAQRFGITEGVLRRALFEDTGGAYPELLTRHDLKTFLPPIGGMTVYIFGPVSYIHDATKELTLRVHDECNGSDVFGSDICTCRPYLIFGIEEAVKCAQRGGVGIVIYFRKEGRALGEVTKYLVYNARKRGGDNASEYFKRTELIAGVKDMRFQALMPDVLHWLGIKKIDNMISMSDMKHDAIVNSGIPIFKRYEIPEELIPPDSRVEIDAKIAAGYYSTTSIKDLSKTAGRLWDPEVATPEVAGGVDGKKKEVHVTIDDLMCDI